MFYKYGKGGVKDVKPSVFLETQEKQNAFVP